MLKINQMLVAHGWLVELDFASDSINDYPLQFPRSALPDEQFQDLRMTDISIVFWVNYVSKPHSSQ